MKVLIKFFDFYINSSIHVAFAVFCLLEITIISNRLNSISNFSICVFFGTVIGYNFLKYYAVFKSRNYRSNKYYSILAVTFLAVIGFLYSFYYLNFSVQKLILISGLLVLIYPFLRKLGWLKLFLVSFVVTFITVYIPFQNSKWLPLEFYTSIFQRFFILISLLIPFEIMDIKTDDKSLNTLPQQFGIDSTKLFGILVVIPFIVLEFLKLHPSYLVLPIGISTVTLINFTELKRNKYYTSFWIESVPIFWWLLLVLFQ
ncbi:hypothetical protein FNW25_10455 [Flavobacterium franklandianum]|uniref:Prenyltransferase n=1 Tax=Flavobacterium franklandianum TaxID=2594430 RepID=A0A553CQS5_9FLAO|nr:hypothetical protein [Flavobacterium franklandianum]TRX22893.1 hypothetical protein FNW17_03770 [Flavobacterium franklandianum]TRX24961.1 hypothetical protein FNW25_10455 [Flavobacterium franklandianum]